MKIGRRPLAWAGALLVAQPARRPLFSACPPALAADSELLAAPTQQQQKRGIGGGSPWWSADRLGPTDAPLPENVFKRILDGKLPADVVEDDGDLFTFRDIRPASQLHLLVIPRRFVRDAS